MFVNVVICWENQQLLLGLLSFSLFSFEQNSRYELEKRFISVKRGWDLVVSAPDIWSCDWRWCSLLNKANGKINFKLTICIVLYS